MDVAPINGIPLRTRARVIRARSARPRAPGDVLPHSLEAERSIVGGVLLRAAALEQLGDLVPEDFYHPAHEAIFAAMLAVAAAGAPVDQVTVGDRMKADGTAKELRAHGGEAYFAELTSGVATVENIAFHGKMVRELAFKRRLLEQAEQLVTAAKSAATREDLVDLVRGLALDAGDEGPAPAKREELLPLLRLSAIADPGPTRWLIQDLWTAGAFGIVGAEPKAWKSYLTLYLAICVGAGLRAFNRFDVTQGRVLMFSAEGGTGLVRQRAAAMCRALDIRLEDIELDVVNLPVLRLDEPETVARIFATVAATKPVLVVLDPLRELHTADENDAGAIAKLLGPLRTLQFDHHCACMLVHHMRKAAEGAGYKGAAPRGGQRLRGSSALHGATDSALYLSVSGTGDTKRVTVTPEHRAAPEAAPFTLVMKKLDGPDGQAVWLELFEEEGAEAEARDVEQDVKREAALHRRILQAIRAASLPGREPIRSARRLRQLVKTNDVALRTAVAELSAAGQILVDKKLGFRLVEGGSDGA